MLSAVTVTGALLIAGSSMADVPETTLPGTNMGFLTDTEVQLRRDTLGFTRAFDGKVALQNRKTNSWWDVKLDLKSPGTLLLRAPQGTVHYLAYESLTQIDLSDDEVVAAIAGSAWEDGVVPVEDMDEQEQLHKMELTREGFYQIVSLVNP